MRFNYALFTGAFYLIFIICGCGGCKKNCNTSPSINGNIYLNSDSSKLFINYTVNDNENVVRIYKKITLGENVIEDEEVKQNVIKNDSFDITQIKKSSLLKLDLQASEEFSRYSGYEKCYYEALPPVKFSMSIILKRDNVILLYNTREISLLIFLSFLLGCLVLPSFILEENKKTFKRAIRNFCVLFPVCVGSIISVLQLNLLIEGASNIFNYFIMITSIIISIILAYFINKLLIPKIRI